MFFFSFFAISFPPVFGSYSLTIIFSPVVSSFVFINFFTSYQLPITTILGFFDSSQPMNPEKDSPLRWFDSADFAGFTVWELHTLYILHTPVYSINLCTNCYLRNEVYCILFGRKPSCFILLVCHKTINIYSVDDDIIITEITWYGYGVVLTRVQVLMFVANCLEKQQQT